MESEENTQFLFVCRASLGIVCVNCFPLRNKNGFFSRNTAHPGFLVSVYFLISFQTVSHDHVMEAPFTLSQRILVVLGTWRCPHPCTTCPDWRPPFALCVTCPLRFRPATAAAGHAAQPAPDQVSVRAADAAAAIGRVRDAATPTGVRP